MRCAMTSSVRLRPPKAPLVQSRTACAQAGFSSAAQFQQQAGGLMSLGGMASWAAGRLLTAPTHSWLPHTCWISASVARSTLAVASSSARTAAS